MTLFGRLEKQEALSRKNSIEPGSEVKVKIAAKEALEDKQAWASEKKLQNIFDRFPVETLMRPFTETPKSKRRDERVLINPVTRQRKLTFEKSSVL